MTEYEYTDVNGDVFEAHAHNTANGERVLRLTCATAYPGPREVTVHVPLHDAPDLIEALQALHDDATAKLGQVDALTVMHGKVEAHRVTIAALQRQVLRLEGALHDVAGGAEWPWRDVALAALDKGDAA